MNIKEEKWQRTTGSFAQAGCCLVGHFAGFWKFTPRPSLTDTPACRQAAKTLGTTADSTADNEIKK